MEAQGRILRRFKGLQRHKHIQHSAETTQDFSRYWGQQKHIHILLQTTSNETDTTGQRNKEPSMAWGRTPTGPSVIRIMGGREGGGWGEGGGLGGGPGAGGWQGALGRAGRPPNNTCCIGVWTNHLSRARVRFWVLIQTLLLTLQNSSFEEKKIPPQTTQNRFSYE